MNRLKLLGASFVLLLWLLTGLGGGLMAQESIAVWKFPQSTYTATCVSDAITASDCELTTVGQASLMTSGTTQNNANTALCDATDETRALQITSYSGQEQSLIFKVPTTAFMDIKLSYDSKVFAATGFSKHTWYYSMDGENYIGLDTLENMNVLEYTTTDLDFSTVTALNYAGSVYFKLVLSGATSTTPGYYDNFVFKGTQPTCKAPVNVTASNVTATSAKISWTPADGTNEVEYTISYTYRANMSPADGVQLRTIGATRRNITGLASGYTYYVYVKSDCDDETTSVWSQACTFTTCAVPSVTSFDVTGEGASLKWTKVEGATYQLCLSTTNAADWTSPIEVTDTFYTATGLESTTRYYAFVRALCPTCSCTVSDAGSTNFTTLCGVVALPIVEGFNSSSIPNCWSQTSVSGSSVVSFVASGSSPSTTAPEGSRMVYWNSWSISSGNSTRLVSCQINASSASNGVTVNYKWYHSNSGSLDAGESVKVQYSLDGTTWQDACEAVPRYATTSGWVDYNVDIPALANVSGCYIGFLFSSARGYNCYMDDVRIVASPTCLRPTALAVNNITGEGATLSWTAGLEETNWDVVVSETALDDPAEGTINQVATTASYTATGLNSNTMYYVYVRANCGEGDVSEWISATFTTRCGYATVPYVMDFESVTGSYQIPECWNREVAYVSGTTVYPYVTNSSSSAYEGSRYLYMYIPSTTTAVRENIISMPSFENLNTLQIEFYAKISGTTMPDYLQVGYMGENGFVEIEDVASSLTSNYQKFTVSLATAPATASVLALRTAKADGYVYVYVDNIRVINIPTCFVPTALTVAETSITGSGATASWTAGADETNWDVVVSETALEDPAEGTILTATANSYTFTGLQGSTTYNVYVRANCGEGDVSEWAHTTFVTACGAVVLPISEGFNDASMPICWTVTGSSTYILTSTTQHFEGSRSLCFNSSSASSGTKAQVVTPALDCSAASTGVIVSFMWYHSNNYPSYSNEGVQIQYSTDGENWQNVGAFIARPRSTNGWEKYTVNVLDLANVSEGYVRFDFSSQWGTYCYVDDVRIEAAPTCPTPSSLAYGNNTLNWTAGASETQWDIVISDTELENPATSEEMVTRSDNPYTIEFDLTPNTDYYAYVRANCGEGDVSEWISTSFHTPCSAVALPYSEDFESYTGVSYSSTTGVAPDCWKVAATNTSNVKPHVIGSGDYYYVNSGTKALTFYGSGDCYAALPYFEGSLNNLIVEFYSAMESTSYGTLSLGYIKDNDVNFNTFTQIASYESSYHSMSFHKTNLSDISAEADRLVFKWTYSNQYSCCIDDIRIYVLNTEAEILDFTFANQTRAAIINSENATVRCEVAASTPADMILTPSGIVLSEGATVAPLANVAQEFTSSKDYTVTAEDGVTTKVWHVSVSRAAETLVANDITSFTFTGIVGEAAIDAIAHTVTATAAWNKAINALVPSITVSPLASIDSVIIATDTVLYTASLATNFTNAVKYIVKAENGAKQDWIVTITNEPAPEGLACSSAIPYGELDGHLVEGTMAQNGYIWYSFSIDRTYSYVTVSTCGTEFDNRFQVYNTCEGVNVHPAYSNTASDICIGGDDDSCEDPTTNAATKTFNNLAAGTYYIIMQPYNSNYGDWDLAITGSSCGAPTNLAAPLALLENDEATVVWNTLNAGDAIQLAYGLAADFDLTDNTTYALTTATTDTFKVVNGLTSETEYKVAARMVCGTDEYSAWSTPVTFITQPDCYIPTTIEVVPTATTATITWECQVATSWRMQIKKSSESWDRAIEITVDSRTFNIRRLTPNTSYDVRILGICSEDDESAYSETTSFRTLCDVIAEFPYTEGFEDANTFNCWERIISYTSGSTVYPYVYTYGYNTGSHSLYMSTSATATPSAPQNVIAMPEMQNINDLKVTFYAKASTAPDSFQFGYIDAENHFQAIETFALTTTHQMFTAYTFNVPSTVTRLAFRSFKETGYSSVYVDDINITLIPACTEPFNLQASVTSSTSATISWTDVRPTNNYEFVISTTAINTTTATGAAITLEEDAARTIVIDTLAANTTYYVALRNVCGENSFGNWVTGTFATPCNAIETLPYAEGFESTTCPAECWSIVYTDANPPSGNIMRHVTVSDTDYDLYTTTEGSRVFQFSSFSSSISSTYTQYLITPLINISTPALVSFDYQQYGSSDYLYIGYSSEDNDVADYTWTRLTASVGEWTSYTKLIPAGTKYFAIKYDGDFAYYAWIDNFRIELASDDNDIVRYSITSPDIQIGDATIDTENHIVRVTVSSTAVLTQVTANIEVSTDATLSPAVYTRDYSSMDVTYNVIAQSGLSQEWHILVDRAPADTMAYISEFTFAGQKAGTTAVIDSVQFRVNAVAEWNTDLTNIAPTVTYSRLATMTPESGVAQDFTAPVHYVVTAEDQEEAHTHDYIVTIVNDPDACINPETITVSNLASHAADLGWTKSYTEESYVVIVATATDTIMNDTVIAEANNVVNLTELTANTTYNVSVKSSCTEGNDWTRTTFTTSCDALSVPYTENFESYTATGATTAGTLPECWKTIYTGTTTGASPHVSTERAPEGNGLLLIASSSSSYGANTYVVFPDFDADLEDLVVEFDYKMENTSCALTFGYVTDATDAATFTAIGDDLTNSTSKVSFYKKLENETIADGARLALRWTNNTPTWRGCGIDNVVVRNQSGANDILTFVLEQQFTDATIDTVAHTVNSTIRMTSDITSQIPQITVSDHAEITLVNDAAYVAGTAQDFTNDVVYTVVAENGDAQQWTVHVENAENLSSEKDIIAFTFTGQVGEAVISAEDSLVKAYAAWNYNFSRDITPTVTVSNFATITFVNDTVAYAYPTPQATNFADTVTYTVVAEDGTSKIWRAVIENDPDACVNPTGLAVSNVTAYTAHVAWVPGYNETSYRVQVSTTSISDHANPANEYVYNDIVEDTLLDLTNLDPVTRYYVYVQSNCDGVTTWLSRNFTTECGEFALSYTETFEDYTSGLPQCWYHAADGTAAVQSTSTYAHNGTKSLKFSGANSNNIAVLPEFEEEVSNIMVSFWTRPEDVSYYSSCGSFDIGYVDSNNAFTAVETYNYNDGEFAGSVYAYKEVYMTGAPAGSRLAFRHRATSTVYYWFVDDINVTEIPSCLPVNNVAACNILANSANITWSAPEEQSAWQIVIADVELNDFSNVTTIDVRDTTYVASNLVGNTLYYAYVRANCGEGDFGPWRNISFTTDCEAIDAPYAQTFEDVTGSYAIPDCWERVEAYTSGTSVYPYVYSYSSSAHNGSKCLYMCYDNTVALPAMNNVNTLMMKFWAMYGSAPESFQVGYIDDNDEFVSVQNIALTSTYAEYEVYFNEAPATARKIAIRSDNNDVYSSVYVDDINVTAIPACMYVADVAAEDVDATTASISWTDINEASAWDVVVSTTALTDPSTGIIQNATANPFDLTGLTANTLYHAYVRTNCGEGDFSDWRDTTFTTTQNCWVNNLEARNIDATTATLVWESGAASTMWNLVYADSTMTTAELNAVANPIEVTTAASYDLTGLTTQTTYYAYVRAICTEDTIAWISTSFTTTQVLATLPYACDFEDATENANWTLANGAATNNWVIGTAANNGGNNGLYISDDNGISCDYSESYSYVYAYRQLNFTETGSYTVNFDWKGYGEGNWDCMRTFIVPNTVASIFVGGTSSNPTSLGGSNTTTPAGWVDISNYTSVSLSGSETWLTNTKTFEIAEPGVYNLVYYWKNDGSTYDHRGPAAVDNISVVPVTDTIFASAGANGTITPSDTVLVMHGGSKSFTIAPAAGYQIDSVLVDGVNNPEAVAAGVYTFTNVTANHTISATFVELPVATYTITAIAGEHGAITPAGDSVVREGATVVYTITPDENYQIDVVTVDGADATADVVEGVYTFANVDANHTISVTFVPVTSVDILEAGSIAAYPNPNNGMFNIDFSNIEGDATYQLVDVKGAMIDSREINVMNGETMNFNYDLRPGTYFVRIITSDNVYVEQIVVR